MNEQEWLACPFANVLFKHMQETAGARKVRLFAVACCRRLWPCLVDERSRLAVETAERFADCQATAEEIATAFASAQVAFEWRMHQAEEMGRRGWSFHAAWIASLAAWDPAEWRGTPWSAGNAAIQRIARTYAFDGATEEGNDHGTEFAHFADLLRDIFPNPFRPPPVLDPSWLAWHRGLVVDLARTIYSERTFEYMPILGDALADAGCTDPDILTHCHGPTTHVRGCWVVDAILGNE